ncbi:hypothetical protein BC332_24060 [Capsicum chinense]|nr:hypothetical protein BC332_24060 [Capsicum chinense]
MGFTASTVSALVYEEVPMDFVTCLSGLKVASEIIRLHGHPQVIVTAIPNLWTHLEEFHRLQGKIPSMITAYHVQMDGQSEALSPNGRKPPTTVQYVMTAQEWADFLPNLDEKVLTWDGGFVMTENGDGIAGDDGLAVDENIWPVKLLRRSKKERRQSQ